MMKEVYFFLKEYVKKNNIKTLVSATSGGPDSMALLYMLSTLKKEIDIDVVCAHVNHNVRKESADEKIFVENFCKKNDVIFEYMKIGSYEQDNFHKEARSKRYIYFEKILKKYHTSYLLTAHHADDLMETILMRMVRGSTLKGYCGFSKVSTYKDYEIIRPFIEITKSEIYAYNEKHQIPFVIDASNKKDVYTRNRFRKYIVPPLKEEDSLVHKKFYKFSRTLLEYSTYIDQIICQKLEAVCPHNKIQIEKYKKEDILIQKEIIRYLLEQIYQDDLGLITDKHTTFIMETIYSDKANIEISLPNKVKGIKSYHEFWFQVENKKEKNYEMVLTDRVILPNGYTIYKGEDENENNHYICRLSKDEITLPLYVRTKKTGDKMTVKGMKGHKKINHIFMENKIDIYQRTIYPIVTDAKGNILWLPGLKKTQFDKSKGEKYDIILKYHELKGENDE